MIETINEIISTTSKSVKIKFIKLFDDNNQTINPYMIRPKNL